MTKKLNWAETRKSHSWWWDSHFSPKNSKWMTESLEEMERLKAGIAQRGEDVEALNKDLEALKLKYDILVAERDGLKVKVDLVMAEVSCRDDRMEKMEEHMKGLLMEQVKLLMGAERGRKVVEELGGKVKELEEVVERQRVAISKGAEEKREAIASFVSRWIITGMGISSFARLLLALATTNASGY